MLSLLSRDGFRQKLVNVVKNFLTIISNGTGFFFTLTQVLFSLVYFVKSIFKEKLLQIVQKEDYFYYDKTGGCEHPIKVAREQEIFSILNSM